MQNQEDAKKDPSVIQNELAETKKELERMNQLYYAKHQHNLKMQEEIMQLQEQLRQKDYRLGMYSDKAKMQKNEECRELHQKMRESYKRNY